MREDQNFLEKFKKNPEFENVLHVLNESLFQAENDGYKNLPEEHATLHIVGSPRSGTTLLNQLVSSSTDVGYINNLIAAFWKTPVHGVLLSKKLLGLDYDSNFSSDFGKTNSISEPHEFTYFWSYFLKYHQIAQLTPEHDATIDWAHLRLVLVNMCRAFGTSIVFKSLYLGWHMESFLKVMHKTLFLFVERNILDNAWSLLQIRRKYFGTSQEWASIKPLQFDELKQLDPYEQVIGQVYYLNQSYKEQLQRISPDHYLTVSYEELCKYPNEFMNRIIKKLEVFSVKQTLVRKPPEFFSHERRIEKKEWIRLNEAYEKLAAKINMKSASSLIVNG